MPFSAHVLHVSFILVDTEDHCHLVSIDLVSAGLSPAKKRDRVLKRLFSTLDWRSHLVLMAIPSRVEAIFKFVYLVDL